MGKVKQGGGVREEGKGKGRKRGERTEQKREKVGS